MPEPTTPILLRVPTKLAEMMTEAAAHEGASRNAWMVGWLEYGVEESYVESRDGARVAAAQAARAAEGLG